MSFSYDELLTTDLDYIRFRLADIDEDDPILSDETINALLGLYGIERALIESCNAVKLFYAKEVTTIGLTAGRRFVYADRYKAYAALYEELKAEYGMSAIASQDGVRIEVLPLGPEGDEYFLPLQPFFPQGY